MTKDIDMVIVISRKSTETRKGCHSVSVLFSMVMIISFVPIFVAGFGQGTMHECLLSLCTYLVRPITVYIILTMHFIIQYYHTL